MAELKVNIKNNKSTICILTAGVGSRMGIYSDIINKSLLPVNGKAIISHIIEYFNKNSTFIIGLGFKSEQVKTYLKIAHPNNNFKFVKINNYTGKGSGPGKSLLLCKKYLNKEFFFISCDTLLNEKQLSKINFNKNYVGTFKLKSKKINEYCNFGLTNNLITNIFDKKVPSKNIMHTSFVGFCFIKDYKIFWNSLIKNNDKNNEIQISRGFVDLVKNKSLFSKQLIWNDLGSYDLYKKHLKKYIKYDFSKKDEFIYFLNKKVIKFDVDSKKINKKFKKFKINSKIFPSNISKFNNFLTYDFVNGKTFYKINSRKKFADLLLWLKDKLWVHPLKNSQILKKDAKLFYKKKTYDRLDLFLRKNKYVDKINYVNSKKVKKISVYLKKINWQYLENSSPNFIHGDLQFDNIIFFRDKFTLIDWRDSFGLNIKYGDLYYDLSKLYGGMHINYDYVKLNKMYYFEEGNNITFNLEKRKIMNKYIKEFDKFIKSNFFDIKKINLLLPVIFLNMAPMHLHPFDKILFSYSKILFEEYFHKYD